MTPQEENVDMTRFAPERAHLLLQIVYRDSLHHNDRLHLDGEVLEDAAWQRRWCLLAAQSNRWYATTSREIGQRFTAILDAEWRGVLGTICNSERPLIFAHFVPTKTSGVYRAREICAWISRRMDLWERGIYTCIVGNTEAEGVTREGRDTSGGEDEDKRKDWRYHNTVLSGILRQAVHWATGREG